MGKLDAVIGRLNGKPSRDEALVDALMEFSRMRESSASVMQKALRDFRGALGGDIGAQAKRMEAELAAQTRQVGAMLDARAKQLSDGIAALSKLVGELRATLPMLVDALNKSGDGRKGELVALSKSVLEAVDRVPGRVRIPEAEAMDLRPLLAAIESLRVEPEKSETEWVFEVHRDEFTGKIETVTARPG